MVWFSVFAVRGHPHVILLFLVKSHACIIHVSEQVVFATLLAKSINHILKIDTILLIAITDRDGTVVGMLLRTLNISCVLVAICPPCFACLSYCHVTV